MNNIFINTNTSIFLSCFNSQFMTNDMCIKEGFINLSDFEFIDKIENVKPIIKKYQVNRLQNISNYNLITIVTSLIAQKQYYGLNDTVLECINNIKNDLHVKMLQDILHNDLKYYLLLLKFLDMDIVKYINPFLLNRQKVLDDIKINLKMFNMEFIDMNVDDTKIFINDLLNINLRPIMFTKIIILKLTHTYNFNKNIAPGLKIFLKNKIDKILFINELYDYATNTNMLPKYLFNELDKQILEKPIPFVISSNNVINNIFDIKNINTNNDNNKFELIKLFKILNLDINVNVNGNIFNNV